MENNTVITNNTDQEDENLNFSENTKKYLLETGNWTLFFAILGFIFIGLMILAALFAGTLFSTFSTQEHPLPSFVGILIGIVYVFIAILYFFPIYYLYTFATQIKKALVQKDNFLLESAFKNLKSHYKFIGILTIVVLAFYLLFGLGALLITAF
jgi:Family of unknown function (DUF5362)